MRIKRKFQGFIPAGKILDMFSKSKVDAYSCNQVNELTNKSAIIVFTYGSPSFVDSQKVVNWGGHSKVGDFYWDEQNSRIVVPAGTAKFIEVYGKIAGGGYAFASVNIENGSNLSSVRDLYQFAGNTYFTAPLSTRLYEIPDVTKDTYIYLNCSGYNGSTFLLNSGFGEGESYLGVTKIS